MPRAKTEANREKMRAYSAQHYLENKSDYIERSAKTKAQTRLRLKKFVNRYKILCGCVDCGYKKNPLALQLDHVRGTKTKDVSVMIQWCFSMTKLKEEIRKCEVRCANCHFIITADRRGGADSNCQ